MRKITAILAIASPLMLGVFDANAEERADLQFLWCGGYILNIDAVRNIAYHGKDKVVFEYIAAESRLTISGDELPCKALSVLELPFVDGAVR